MLSRSDANEKLRFAIALLKGESWSYHHQFNKVIVVEEQIRMLSEAGFWWQAKVLRHHLNLWKASQHRLDKDYSQKTEGLSNSEKGLKKANLGSVEACREQDPGRRPEDETEIVAKKLKSILQPSKADTLSRERREDSC
jgi:hypothetical protein